MDKPYVFVFICFSMCISVYVYINIRKCIYRINVIHINIYTRELEKEERNGPNRYAAVYVVVAVGLRTVKSQRLDRDTAKEHKHPTWMGPRPCARSALWAWMCRLYVRRENSKWGMFYDAIDHSNSARLPPPGGGAYLPWS